MDLLLLPLPLFLFFEFWQLVVAERYLGIAWIEQGMDPRRLPMRRGKAALWSVGIIAGWLWALSLLLVPLARGPAACILVVSLAGVLLRRNVSVKWILVSLTFEGAIRIGMMLFLIGALWRHIR